jgi:hypothetical protein
MIIYNRHTFSARLRIIYERRNFCYSEIYFYYYERVLIHAEKAVVYLYHGKSNYVYPRTIVSVS